MAHTLPALIVLAVIANAAAAPSQVRPDHIDPRRDIDFRAPEGAVHFDTDEDGAHWVMGDTYKARVAGDGFTYIPFLGSRAPRTYPVEMRLACATAGGTGLELASRGTVTRTGDRIVIDRGPVQVIYDVAPDGVEQSFLFDERLSGALELEVAMTSEMSARADGLGYRWESALGGMVYGEATAIDAAGAEVAVSSSLVAGPNDAGGAIRIRHRVAEEFVRSASGPVLVDPWIYTYSFDSSTKFVESPVAVYDRIEDAYMIVFEETFAANDTDLRRVHVNAFTGALLSSPDYVDFSSFDVRRPTIAHTVAPNVFLVAATHRNFTPSRNRVIGRRITGAGSTAGAWRTLANASSSDSGSYAPRLGGDNSPSGTNHFGLVTLMRDGAYEEVQFHRISAATGSPVANSERRLVRKLGSLLEDVDMSPTTGNPGEDREWVVALLENYSAANRMKVQTIRVGHDGNVVQSLSTVHTSDYISRTSPLQVSTLGSKRSPTTGKPYYLVTYADDGAGMAVLCSGATGHHAVRLGETLHESTSAAFDSFMRTRATRHGWMIAHGYNGSTPSTAGLRLTTLTPANDRLGAIDRRRLLDTSGSHYNFVGAASTFDGGSDVYSDGLAVWVEINQPGGENRIEGSIVIGMNEQAAGSQYCFGTPNSTQERGFIRAVGTTSRFSSKSLQASGLPPSELGYFLASPSQGFSPAAWGGSGTLCLSAARYISGSFQRVSDEGTMEFTLLPTQLPTASGPVSATAGASWHIQGWHLDNTTSNFTNAITITFD